MSAPDVNAVPPEQYPGSLWASWRADGRFVVTAGALSLLLPILHLGTLSKLPTFSFPIIDSIEYVNLARQMLGTLPADHAPYLHSPFYGWLLAAAFQSGLGLLEVRLLQAALNAATCLLLYSIAQRCFSRQVGRLSALGWALYGPIIFFSTEILSVPWVLFLNLASLNAVLNASERPSAARWLAAGLATGLAATARPDILLFSAAIGLLIVASGEHGFIRRLWLRATPFFAGIVLPLLVVVACNAARSGRYLALPVNSGLNFYIGNNPHHVTTIGIRPGGAFDALLDRPLRAGLGGGRNAPEHSRYFYAQAWEFARGDPAGFARALLFKLRALVSSYELPETLDLYTTASQGGVLSWLTWRWGTFGFPFGLMFPFAVLGLWLAREELRRRPAVVVMLGCFAASLLIYWPSARYRMGLIPPLLMLAAVAVDDIWSDRRRLAARGAITGLVCFGLAAVAANLPLSHFSQRFNFLSEMYYLAGRERVELGQLEQGQRWIEHALMLDPDNAEAHNSLGINLAKQGRLDEAARHFRFAVRLRPDDAALAANLARVLGQGAERRVR